MLIPRLTTSPTHAKFLPVILFLFQDCCISCVSFSVLYISLVIFCLEVMQNFSVLKFISLLHIPSSAASQVSKAFNDFQSGLKKLEEYMSCLKAAEVNGGFIEMDLRAWHCQVKNDLSSAMQRHIPAGGRWTGILVSFSVIPLCLCQRRCELAECSEVCLIWCRCFCSTVSELLSLSLLQLFNLAFYNNVHKLQNHIFALQKSKI